MKWRWKRNQVGGVEAGGAGREEVEVEEVEVPSPAAVEVGRETEVENGKKQKWEEAEEEAPLQAGRGGRRRREDGTITVSYDGQMTDGRTVARLVGLGAGLTEARQGGVFYQQKERRGSTTGNKEEEILSVVQWRPLLHL